MVPTWVNALFSPDANLFIPAVAANATRTSINRYSTNPWPARLHVAYEANINGIACSVSPRVILKARHGHTHNQRKHSHSDDFTLHQDALRFDRCSAGSLFLLANLSGFGVDIGWLSCGLHHGFLHAVFSCPIQAYFVSIRIIHISVPPAPGHHAG